MSINLEFKYDLQRFDEGNNNPPPDNTPKSKEEIVAVLKTMEGGAGYLAGFNKILKDGTQQATTLTKLQGDFAVLTQERDGATERFNKVMDFAGVPADVDDLDKKLEELREERKKNNKSDVDIALLQSKNNEITRQMEKIKKERDEHKVLADKRNARIQSIIRDGEISRAVQDCGALEADALIPIFRDQVKILTDETAVYPLEDGSNVTVAEGIKMFFEKHPRLLANNQNAGGGSGGGTPGKVDISNMSQSEYEKARKEGKL